MKNKQRRVESAMRELYAMHEELFGQKYSIGITLDQQSQFNKIIEDFRELIFTIRSTQQEREKRQNKKNFKNTPESVRINHEIRQDILMAEEILKEAAKRHKTSDKTVSEHRDKVLKNCYELLSDAKQTEKGGVYVPPPVPTLEDIKRDLIGKEYRISEKSIEINLQEEQAIDQFNRNDAQMDGIIDEIIDADGRVREKMKNANQAIEQTHQKIIKRNKQVGELTERVKKADKDLEQILKNVRICLLKYRRPSKLCLDVTLVLLLLALIGVIINLIRS